MKMDEYNEMNTRIFNWKMMITYMSIYMNNWEIEIEITYILLYFQKQKYYIHKIIYINGFGSIHCTQRCTQRKSLVWYHISIKVMR